MTTSYFIHCEACKQTLDSFEVGHFEKRLLYAIIERAYDIPAITPLLEQSQGNLYLGTSESRRLDTRWFAEHRGAHHPLVVIDENDSIDDRCGARYTCSECSTVHYCNREKHSGNAHGGRL